MSDSAAQGADRSARPVGARLRRAARVCRHGFRAGVWWFNSILGGQDYQRYVEHLRRRHPDRAVPTEREYWRQRHAEADRNPANRCC
ncbi:YbdD/YjiX family protein [Nocardia abscessus]|uniref:YbdD/YjiX family protein n=1 Tax=Nocardia abscessus TaxID=120957 RepID=A0ABS0C7I5_9NOCA|nr:YbdD/YjiX family protein [Nocardia abscessus]